MCDFESFLSPIDHDDTDVKTTRLIDELKVCGFACYRVTDMEQYQTAPVVYSGPDVMDKFYEHVMQESETITKIISGDKDMNPLTPEQQTDYDAATTCWTCGVPFTRDNQKVRHHCHITGNFLFAACNNCNLQL